MKSGYQKECILEESSDEDIEIYKSRSKIPVPEKIKNGKSVSRSSSGIGTSSRPSSKKRDFSDETSSRCFSPPFSDNQEDFGNGKFETKRNVTSVQDKKYGTLKSLKKSLSMRKSKSKLDLLPSKEHERYNLAQKTPILDKYDPNDIQENDDEDFGSFSDEDGSFSMSDFEENEDAERYSKIHKITVQNKKTKEMSNRYSISNLQLNEEKKRSNKGKDETENTSLLNHGNYLKKYRGKIVQNSDSDSENEEEKMEGKKEKKYSNQLKECSDYASNDELLTDKPAINTLKKTFSNMLSKIPVFARQRADSSSISDNCSVLSRSSKLLDTESRGDRHSRKIDRTNSTASVNIKRSGIQPYIFILIFNYYLFRRPWKENIHVLFFRGWKRIHNI